MTETHVEEELSFFIPIQYSTDAVQVPFSILPDHSEHVLNLLMKEVAPLDLWARVAIEYLKLGLLEEFEHIMGYAVHPDIKQFYPDPQERSYALGVMGAYLLQKALNATNLQEHAELLEEASSTFDQIDSMLPTQRDTALVQSLLQIVLGRYERAEMEIQAALRMSNDDPRALACRALLYFRQGKFRKALRDYQQILESKIPFPGVRVGIGLCFYHIGDFEAAHMAFQRALDVWPDNAHAMVGLAAVKLQLRRSGIIDGKPEALLEKAFEIAPTDVHVIHTLCEHLFYQGHIENTVDLLKSAESSQKLPKFHLSQAETLYQQARTLHALHDLRSAEPLYAEAIRHAPDDCRALFGLAQSFLARCDQDNALMCLRKAYVQMPDNSAVLGLLGTLLASSSDEKDLKEAKVLLSKAIRSSPDNDELVIVHSQLIESTQPELALRGYLGIVEAMGEDNAPIELLGNIAALHLRLGHTKKAFQVLSKAKERHDHPCLDFNLAIVYERFGELDKAKVLYSKVTDVFPEARVCYGYVQELEGDTEGALATYKSLGDNPDALIARGNICIAKEDFEGALELYKSAGDSVYARLKEAQALFLKFQSMRKTSKPEKRQEANRAFFNAQEIYLNTLKADPHNIAAANGLGACLALSNKVPQAQEVFQRIRESKIPYPQSATNLAHILSKQTLYEKAVRQYQLHMSTSEQFLEEHIDLLNYIGRAEYFSEYAGTFGNTRQAKRLLSKVLFLAPTDMKSRFNLALCCGDQADCILENVREIMRSHEKDVDLTAFDQVLAEYAQAERIFRVLRHTKLASSFVRQKSKDMVKKYMQHTKDAVKFIEKVKEKLEKERVQREHDKERWGQGTLSQEISKRSVESFDSKTTLNGTEPSESEIPLKRRRIESGEEFS